MTAAYLALIGLPLLIVALSVMVFCLARRADRGA